MSIAKRLLARTERKKHRLPSSVADRVLNRLFGTWTYEIQEPEPTPVQGVLFCEDEVQSDKHGEFRRKSKGEIRAWLRTEEGMAWMVRKSEEKNDFKEKLRKERAMEEAMRAGVHFDCSVCLAHIGRHCPWVLPHGCLDYIEKGTGRNGHEIASEALRTTGSTDCLVFSPLLKSAKPDIDGKDKPDAAHN